MKISNNDDKISISCMVVAFYFAIMPFGMVNLGGAGSFLRVITLPIACICLFSLVFVGNSRINFNFVHLFYILYFIYCVIVLLWRFDSFAMRAVRGYFELTLITFIFSVPVYNEKERKLFKYAFLFVGAISILFNFFSVTVMEEGRKTINFLGSYCDPNELCGFLLMPALICLEFIIGKHRNKLFYTIFFFLLVYVGLSTGSRGGLIAIVVTIVSYVLIVSKGVKKKSIACVGLAAIICISVFVIYPILPESLQSRFSIERIAEDKGTGRFDIWKILLESATQQENFLIFGQGLSSTGDVLKKHDIYNNVAHNQFVQLLHDQGLVGVVLFFGILFAGMIRNYKKNKMLVAALLGVIAMSMSINFDTSVKIFWNIIMFSAFSYSDFLIQPQNQTKFISTKGTDDER